MTVFLIVLYILVLIVLIASYIVYRKTFYTPVKHQNDIEWMNGHYKYAIKIAEMTNSMAARKCEMVYTESEDGLKLEGRYYSSPVSPSAPVAICAHGYRGVSLMDFSGGGPLMLNLGMNVLLISERGCMGSEGHTITFGVKEKGDILRWIEWVKKRNGENAPIYLMGISMGAHTVLYSSDSLAGSNIRGIIADCPYTSSRAITDKVLASHGFSPKALRWFVNLTTSLWGGFMLTSRGAVEAVKKSSVPILIIHGTDDHLVPFHMSEEIRDAAPDRVTLVPVEGAGHAESYLTNKNKYVEAVEKFVSATK
jgi:uncharacterized protein